MSNQLQGQRHAMSLGYAAGGAFGVNPLTYTNQGNPQDTARFQ